MRPPPTLTIIAGDCRDLDPVHCTLDHSVDSEHAPVTPVVQQRHAGRQRTIGHGRGGLHFLVHARVLVAVRRLPGQVGVL